MTAATRAGHGPAHQPGAELDHRHRAAQRRGRARQLQPDEPAADHRDPAARGEPPAQRQRVGVGAQDVDRSAAERQRAGRVAPVASSSERYGRRRPSASSRTCAAVSRPAASAPGRKVMSACPQRAGVADRLELTGLGQRRALVRRRRLGADQGDPAGPARARATRTRPACRTRPRRRSPSLPRAAPMPRISRPRCRRCRPRPWSGRCARRRAPARRAPCRWCSRSGRCAWGTRSRRP